MEFGRSAALLITFALMVSCSGPAAGETPADGSSRLPVVATTTQVGASAAEIGGDLIDLTVLLQPGTEAHDYEMTPSDAAALEQADLILISGAGLEDWLDDALATVGGEERIRDMSAGIELRAPAGDEPAHSHDEDEREQDEPGGRDDDGAAYDPHYWLSAPNAVRQVENVRDALVEVLPDASDELTERAAALVERLEEADAEIRRLIDEIPPERRRIVTNHDALGYFIDEYGLTFVGSIFPSLDTSSEPSARDLSELIEEIEREGVAAIFSESAVNPSLARTIAEETDARVVDEPLYTDSLGPPGSDADTLDGMLLHNATVIHEALAER